MKRIVILSLVLMSWLAACGSSAGTADQTVALLITDGAQEKTYATVDLEALPAVEATFNGVTYRGVSLVTLLEDAGYAPAELIEVEAVASDGYRMPYGPDLFLLEDTLVAYAQSDGPLAKDEGTFRMVLPDQEGKMNVRMLAELRLKP